MRIQCVCLVLLFVVKALATDAYSQIGGYHSFEDGNTVYDYRQYYQLSVQAASKASKLSFQADPQELKSGNAATNYLRACLRFYAVPEKKRIELRDFLDEWFNADLAAFPIATAKGHLSELDAVFKEIDLASQKKDCDWGLIGDDFDLLDYAELNLHDLQTLRQIAKINCFRIKVAAADRDFELSVKRVRQGVKLGRDVCQTPIFICKVIGEGMIRYALNAAVVALSESEFSYLHAYQRLPAVLVDYSGAFEFELELLKNTFPFLVSETSSLNSNQLRQQFEVGLKLFDTMMIDDLERQVEYDASRASRLALLMAQLYPRAKRKLASAGLSKTELDKMPAGQVVAMQTQRVYQAIADWLDTPCNNSQIAAIETFDRRYSELSSAGYLVPAANGDFPIVELTDLSLAIDFLPSRRLSVNRQTAMFQIVESLRFSAAKTGQFPEKSQLHMLRWITDPKTGQPFDYQFVDGKNVVLQTKPIQRTVGKTKYHRTEIRIELQLN